ncbi:MAG TPA: hypothetical protein VJQ52_05630 [Steroidobacteraceae bacterium]|nr:hypothetical protein [Steroidobacteraceae bacterium]
MKRETQWTDENLARDWIRRFSSARRRIVSVESADVEVEASKRVDSETFWAFDVFHDLETRDPAHAWALVLLILRLAPDDDGVRDSLAAGPLEGLLANHGRTVIKWVEDEARRNSEFKELLAGVWNTGINELIWQRVERARDRQDT